MVIVGLRFSYRTGWSVWQWNASIVQSECIKLTVTNTGIAMSYKTQINNHITEIPCRH